MPESVKILLRILRFGDDNDGSKTFVAEIQSCYLKLLSEVREDQDQRHDHIHGDPKRYCRLKIVPQFLTCVVGDLSTVCNDAIIGRTVYSMFRILPNQLEFKCFDLDVDPDIPDDEKWTNLPPPPCKAEFPKIFALRGRVYLLVYNTPPLVFDPATLKWSRLDPPPRDPPFDVNRLHLTASLGDTHGKILLYESDHSSPAVLRLYDVDTGIWDVHSIPNLGPFSIADRLIIGDSIVHPREETSLYFLHKHNKVFCFDWKEQRLYSGTVTGIDYMNELVSNCTISFCHVWGQLFCLLWSLSTCSILPDDLPSTYLHFSFIKVIKNTDYTLTAFAVGCQQDIIRDTYRANQVLSLV